MKEPRIIVMTEEQLKQLILETLTQFGVIHNKSNNSNPKRYVYGLRGIRELFKVSHVTAQRYKNTFLKPAVTQHGRKIIIDADKAIELFNQQEYQPNTEK